MEPTKPLFSDEDLMALINSIPRETPKKQNKVKVLATARPHEPICTAVAWSVVSGMSEDDAVALFHKRTDLGGRKGGVTLPSFNAFMAQEGWTFHKRGGRLATTDLTSLPKKCIVLLSNHVAAVVDGVIMDRFVTYTEKGCKNMIGYWAPI